MALNTWAAKNLGPDADISRMPASGGGGGAELYVIPTTSNVPAGKTATQIFYSMDIDGEYLECTNDANGNLRAVLMSDYETVITINSGTSSGGDYLYVSSISCTGGVHPIEDATSSFTITGEGTLTINWGIG